MNFENSAKVFLLIENTKIATMCRTIERKPKNLLKISIFIIFEFIIIFLNFAVFAVFC